MAQENIKQLIQEAQHLKSQRGNLENLWQSASDLTLEVPDNITRTASEGQEGVWYRYDDTAVFANQDRAAHLIGILANPETQWIEIGIKGVDTIDNPDVGERIEKASKTFINLLKNPATIFYKEFHKELLDDGIYGIGAMLVQKGNKAPLNFRTYGVKDFVFCRDDDGAVDRFFLTFKLTLNQAVDKFGLDNLSANLQKLYREQQEGFKEFEFMHVVIPRKDRDGTRKDKFNKRFAGYFVEKKEEHIIDEQGYNTMPYEVFAGLDRANEQYPSSPAMSAIGTIRQLNHHEWLDDVAREKNVNPALLVFDDAVGGGETIDVSAGGVTVVNSRARAGGQKPIQPLNDMLNINYNAEKTLVKRQLVHQAFMVMEFEAMRKANMSATEAVINNDRQLRKASPIISRLFASLGRLLERALEIVVEQDIMIAKARGTELQAGDLILPELYELGEEIGIEDLQFTFKSPLAKALRQEEFEALQLQLNGATLIAQVDPTVLDYYDSVEAFKELSEVLGTTPKTIRSDEEAIAIQEARQQAQQKQQQMETLQQGVDVAKTAGEASQLFQGGQ